MSGKQRTVLVTGGTKGMGEAMVRRLQSGGVSVATTARSPLPHDQVPDLFIQADVGTATGVQVGRLHPLGRRRGYRPARFTLEHW